MNYRLYLCRHVIWFPHVTLISAPHAIWYICIHIQVGSFGLIFLEFPPTACLCMSAQRVEPGYSQHRQLYDCQSCQTPHYPVSSQRRIHINVTMLCWWLGKAIIYLKGQWQTVYLSKSEKWEPLHNKSIRPNINATDRKTRAAVYWPGHWQLISQDSGWGRAQNGKKACFICQMSINKIISQFWVTTVRYATVSTRVEASPSRQ